MKLTQLHIYLPVHNRGGLTASFISHFLSEINDELPFQFWILDDGCTDDTVDRVLGIMPSANIVSLDGKAYWGGALNAIHTLILERHRAGFVQECYLVCNDDIRFAHGALQIALSSLTNQRVVCCLSSVLDHQDLASFDNSVELASTQLPPMHRFDPSNGLFMQELNPSAVNVSSTYGMLTTLHPWMSVGMIPNSIPHYLSDWWLTYSFFMHNYSIVHPAGFLCYTSALTTNNHRIESRPRFRSGLKWLLFALQHCLKSASLTSPSYAPAWITFLKQYSKEPGLFNRLLKLRLAFVLGIALRCFSPFAR